MAKINREKEAALATDHLRKTLHYNPETGLFVWREDRRNRTGGVIRRAGDEAGTTVTNGYRSIVIDRKRYLAHRLAWFYVTGEWPPAYVDHINGNTSDNRFCNLRLATVSQNSANSRRPRTNKSGFKGVIWDKLVKRWRAQIRLNQYPTVIGYFDCPTVAHLAYCKAAREHFGEFARPE